MVSGRRSEAQGALMLGLWGKKKIVKTPEKKNSATSIPPLVAKICRVLRATVYKIKVKIIKTGTRGQKHIFSRGLCHNK